jgi:hypothetical protein
MGVDLIEADGKSESHGQAKDLFHAGAKTYTKIENHAIEEIVEENGVIKFKYKGGVIETAVDDVVSNEAIIAIYNVLGQKQNTNRIEDLPHGTYIVITTAGNKKIAH